MERERMSYTPSPDLHHYVHYVWLHFKDIAGQSGWSLGLILELYSLFEEDRPGKECRVEKGYSDLCHSGGKVSPLSMKEIITNHQQQTDRSQETFWVGCGKWKWNSIRILFMWARLLQVWSSSCSSNTCLSASLSCLCGAVARPAAILFPAGHCMCA